MHAHETAGDRCTETKKAARAGAALSVAECRDLNSDSKKIGSAPRGVNGNLLVATLGRVGGLQRIARGRLSDRPDPVWWRSLAKYACNELLAATPGVHIDRHSETDVIDRPFERTTVTKTRVKRVTWPKTCAATVLCYGRDALFATIDDVPAEILAGVEAGVADALARGRRVRYNGNDIAVALGVTLEQRVAVKAWQIGACDKTDDEMDDFRLQRRADQQRQRRKKKGVRPRDESVAAMARAIGVKPNTLQKKLRRARRKAEKADAQDVLFSKRRNKKKDRVASKKGHEKTSQNRNPPIRPSGAEIGEGFAQVEKPIAADARKIFSERWKMREPDRVANPRAGAAAESIPATSSPSSLAEVRQ